MKSTIKMKQSVGKKRLNISLKNKASLKCTNFNQAVNGLLVFVSSLS